MDLEMYYDVAAKFPQLCEEQRLAARIATDFDRSGLPLLAESYVIEARKLGEQVWDIAGWLKENDPRLPRQAR